jgi:hypothetical protein
VQLNAKVIRFGPIAGEVVSKLVGVTTDIANGAVPVLSRQKSKGADVVPGTRDVKSIPVALPDAVVAHVVSPGVLLIANAAVAESNVLPVNFTVFEPCCAKVIPPAMATTAPIVPIALTIGLILRKLNILHPLFY